MVLIPCPWCEADASSELAALAEVDVWACPECGTAAVTSGSPAHQQQRRPDGV